MDVSPPTADAGGRAVYVRDFMSSPAQLLNSGESLARALELMQEHGIRHLPVVDSNKTLVGLVSDRELYLAKRERGMPPEDVAVDEVMARAPFAIAPSAPIEDAAAVMAQRKYGCAVVELEGRVVGILTTTDVLRALVELRSAERGGAEQHA